MLRTIMHLLERRIYSHDVKDRIVRPFEWGLEFLEGNHNGQNGDDPRRFLKQYNSQIISNSSAFYTPEPIAKSSFEIKASGEDYKHLRFESSIKTPYETNNTVHGRFYHVEGSKKAVIVTPHWNAPADSYVSLCKLLNRFGISTIRLSLPYHDSRKPPETKRAEYMVSANIGRTIQSVRQAVVDIRRTADFLYHNGITQVGVLGTSIGSCVSWLAFIHDERIRTGAFNMVSSWFGDVVWRALTTLHLRKSLETELNEHEIREVWATISPSAYSDKMQDLHRPFLAISASYDLTFLPDLAKIFLDDVEKYGCNGKTIFIPCGHYTLGRSPFKYIDAWHITNHFRKNL